MKSAEKRLAQEEWREILSDFMPNSPSGYEVRRGVRMMIGFFFFLGLALVCFATDFNLTCLIALFLGWVTAIRMKFMRGYRWVGANLAKLGGIICLVYGVIFGLMVSQGEYQGEGNIFKGQERARDSYPLAQNHSSSLTTPPPSYSPERSDDEEDGITTDNLLTPSTALPEIDYSNIEYVPSAESETIAPPPVVPRFTNAESFIRYFRAAETKDDLNLVMKQYYQEVIYFNKTISKAQIRADKEDYWMKWPHREERITSPIEINSQGRFYHEVTFRSQFKNTNEIGHWVSGDLENFYVLEVNDSSPAGVVVLEQRAKASNIKKSTDSVNAPQDTNTRITNFVKRWRVAEAERRLEEIMSYYAGSVTYFDKRMTHSQIRADKANYFRKWPRCEERITSSFSITSLDEGCYRVVFPSSFTTFGSDNSYASGDIVTTVEIDFSLEYPAIYYQSSKLSNYKKSQ